ncbi:MAG: long-chain fatty acid--CoA ligase [Candidatus Marinimicrobia bacterium]|nr:long-chain fatty acid--CoA ligase [Candidatus Neomarinimicrobiota bacterium]
MARYSTITGMFINTTDRFADTYLYYSANNNGMWEGLRGKDIRHTVEDLSYALVSLGLKKGVQGAIISGNGPRWAMADYAILSTGAATVAIYPSLIAKQVAYILNHSESHLVFAENTEQAAKVLEIWDECPHLKTLIVMDDSRITGADLDKKDRQSFTYFDLLESGQAYGKEHGLNFEEMCRTPKPDDLLTLIYTSGTTGDPKGVMLSHNNMVTNIEDSLTCIQITPDDSLLSFLPLCHSFERMAGHFLTFSQGATVYYAESIEKVAENMQATHPTILIGAPRFYEKVYNRVIEKVSKDPALRQKIFWWALAQGKQVLDLRMAGVKAKGWLAFKYKVADKLVFSKMKARVGGRIRFFISGSAPLSADIAEFFAMMGMVVLEGYGLTETTPVITVNKLEQFKFGKVGAAIPNVEVKIADDGEVLVRGPNVMMGYFKNPEATKETIDDDGWLFTGDIGELDDDGFLKITDRKKSILVTSGGKNVAPAPLENSLVTSPFIEQVVVIGDQRNFISALVVPSFEKLKSFAEEQGLAARSVDELIKDDTVIAAVEQEVAKAMEAFSRYEQVRKITLLPRELSIERGEITPTLKVKRNVVLEHFAAEIEAMYAGAMAQPDRA